MSIVGDLMDKANLYMRLRTRERREEFRAHYLQEAQKCLNEANRIRSILEKEERETKKNAEANK